MKKRSHGEHGGTEEDADLFEVRSNRRAVVSAVQRTEGRGIYEKNLTRLRTEGRHCFGVIALIKKG